MNAFQFFKVHAGFSYDSKTETPEQGRVKCARNLARLERAARDGGFYYRWSVDPDIDSSDFINPDEDGGRDAAPWRLWQCAMYNAAGGIVNSLHGIDFGRDKEPWGDPYKRVVEAELAAEGLTNEPQGKGRT